MAATQCLFSVAKKNATSVVSCVVVRNSSSDTSDIRVLKNADLASLKRGTGGRSSFSGMVTTIFGATGFVGNYVANRFGKIGSQIIIPYRSEWYDVKHLKLVGDLGQVLFQPFHLKDVESIKKAIKYSNVVVNLIGREWETRNFKFEDVHVEGARAIARACKEAGVERLIHVSALNVTENPQRYIMSKPSQFFPTKLRGERAVLEEFPSATIIRPADIYGQEDRFAIYYAQILRRQGKWMPLWCKGERTIKQPVFVSDVAQGIVNAAKDRSTAGKIYQAVGPKRYQLGELVDWFYRVMRKTPEDWDYKRYDMRFDPTFLLRAKLFSVLSPSEPPQHVHFERLERECVTDQVIRGMPTLEDLGVTLTHMEDQIPWELRVFKAYSYYDEELGEFPDPAPPKTEPLNPF